MIKRDTMGTTLNRRAYQELVDENIEFAKRHLPPGLEKDHILMILEKSVENEYGKQSPDQTNVDAIDIIRPKFWFMRDNHTFAEIKGNSLDEIRENAYKLAKENPYGMVCPVIIMKGDEEVRRVGEGAHVDSKGGVDLGKWLSSIVHDKDILKNLSECHGL